MAKTLSDYIYDIFESQSACAKELGWTRQKLNNIVLGKSVPSLDDTQQLARVLNQPITTVAKIFLNKTSRK